MNRCRKFGFRLVALALLASLLSTGCREGDGAPPAAARGHVQLVFKTAKLPGDPADWEAIVAGFRREHPTVDLRTESLPNSSDQQHQFYVINLEGGATDFDVFALDTIWGHEFARAGWLLDLTDRLGAERLASLGSDYFPGAVASCFFQGRCWAVPWFMDAGLLYYRSDLLSRHGFTPPRTYQELAAQARSILAAEKDPTLCGFVWQAKQYEGLVCAGLEFIRGNGGDVLRDGRPVLTEPACVEAVAFMRQLVAGGVSPPMVTTADEEAARRVFGDGRAVFMRNWPYAWPLLQGQGSAVKGRVGIAPVPGLSGGRSSPTLGGWQLGINRTSKHPELALAFALYLSRPDVQEQMILKLGISPGRRALYGRPAVLAANAFLGHVATSFEAAVPRPLTPFNLMISQVLQSELSAALAGLRPPAAAMESAQRQLAYILKMEDS